MATNDRKTWDLIMRVAIPLLLAGLIGSGALLLSLDRRVVAIEANRFTNQDGKELQEVLLGHERSHQEKFQTILLGLQSIRDEIGKGDQRETFYLDRISRLEARVERLEGSRERPK